MYSSYRGGEELHSPVDEGEFVVKIPYIPGYGTLPGTRLVKHDETAEQRNTTSPKPCRNKSLPNNNKHTPTFTIYSEWYTTTTTTSFIFKNTTQRHSSSLFYPSCVPYQISHLPSVQGKKCHYYHLVPPNLCDSILYRIIHIVRLHPLFVYHPNPSFLIPYKRWKISELQT
jgi:hypothetical protein